jgi:type IV secretory pathway VirB10-like protein
VLQLSHVAACILSEDDVGRYDSKVSFGQSRLLVVWTLQLGGMSGRMQKTMAASPTG